MSGLRRGVWVIPLSLAAAFILQALPLPPAVAVWTPNWVTLVMLYWCVAAPRLAGVGLGFFTGLAADVLEATLLGQQALAKCAAAFLVVWQRRRFRMYHLWQQACLVPLPVALEQLVSALVRAAAGAGEPDFTDLLPVLTAAPAWPLLFLMLNGLQRLAGLRLAGQ